MMGDWPFEEAPNTAVCTQRQVIHNGNPILIVARDAVGDWQFLDGSDDIGVADCLLVCLSRMLELDPTVGEVADLQPGWEAWRDRPGAPWERGPWEEEDEE